MGRIAFDTGLFGRPAAPYLPSPALFALLWTAPYFTPAGLGNFVATSAGQTVGYIVGAPDPALYRRALAALVLRRGLRVPLGAWWEARRYLVRAAAFPGPHADEGAYPAHLHLNLLAAARGQRLGDALLDAHLRELWRAGVPGVQLSTTSENRAALALYRRHGFGVAARRVTPLWTPWLGHPAEHVVMTLALSPR